MKVLFKIIGIIAAVFLALLIVFYIRGCQIEKGIHNNLYSEHLDFHGIPIYGKLSDFSLPGYVQTGCDGKYEVTFTKGDTRVLVDTYGMPNNKKVYNIVERYPSTKDWEQVKSQYLSVKDSLSSIYRVITCYDSEDLVGIKGIVKPHRGMRATEFCDKDNSLKGYIWVKVQGDITAENWDEDGEAWVEVTYIDGEGNAWVEKHPEYRFY